MFRHGDPKTTTRSPHGPVRRFLASPRGRVTVLTLLILGGLYTNVLPRPVVPDGGTSINWSHWEWFGARFGTQRLPAALVRGATFTWVNWEVSWWMGEVRAVRVVDPDTGAVLWSVRRTGADRFRLEVANGAVEWSDVLTGFNAVRRTDELFGITVNAATMPAGSQPFSAEGAKQDILGAIIRNYGLSISTFIVPHNDGKVWVYDTEAQAMALVDPRLAIELGYMPERNDTATLPRPFDR